MVGLLDATGLAGILAMVGTVLTSVVTWVGQIVTMVLTTGNEILLLPILMTFIAFAVGIFFHFVRS